jgi:tetratricopeptide (TPR) repeat protein
MAAAAAWRIMRVAPGPVPPAVNVADLDPALRPLVEGALARCAARPRDAEPWSELGRLAHGNAEVALAVCAYKQAMALGEPGAEIPYLLGLLLRDQGRGAAALPWLELAIERDAAYGPAYEHLGAALLDFGRAAEAEVVLGRGLERAPASVPCLRLLGAALRQAGRFDEAEAALRRALELNADDHASHHLLGLTLLATGRAEEGRAHLARRRRTRDTVVDDPRLARVQALAASIEVKLDLADNFLKSGRFDGAILLLQRMSQEHAASAKVWRALGRALLAAGRAQQAVDAYLRATDLEPAEPEAHAALAAILLEHGMLEQAQREASAALHQDPDSPQALVVAGTLAVQRGAYAEAESVLGRVAEATPDSLAAHLWHAESLVGLGRDADAVLAYRRALRIDERHAFAQRRLGLAHLRLGQVEEARRHLERALALDPAAGETRQALRALEAGN